MLTSVRGLFAASFAAGLALSATPALANTTPVETYGPISEEDIDRAIEQVDADASSKMGGESGLTFSANAALTTDYRFRGVSLSGGDPAIQGGIDIAHSSGFYVGTWASSIDGGPAFGEMELDLYGGWSGDVAEGVTFDVGLLYYLYPTEDIGANVNYWEPYASVGFSFGPASATVGAAYAWDQNSLGGDNLYVYTDLEFGIPNTPLTIAGHLGYTDGVLAPPLLAGSLDDSGFDYGITASMGFAENFSISVGYVGVDGPSIDGFTDDAIVATLSASF